MRAKHLILTKQEVPKRRLPMLKSRLVTMLFLFSLCSLAFAEESLWEYKKITDDEFFSEEYSLKLHNTTTSMPHTKSYCSVIISRDGNSIIVNAYDYEWYGKTVTQTVKINSDTHKVEKYIRTIENGESPFTRFKEGGYDVFWSKYRPHAEALPAEVRKKFNGQWGIE